jgi:DNA-binding LacI/PurR family transcriptional regulator
VVAQHPYEMGCHAGRLLLERLSDQSKESSRTVVDAPLRHRESGHIRPVR